MNLKRSPFEEVSLRTADFLDELKYNYSYSPL